MTAQLLTADLSTLIQESKRKHADLRNAAEKSLEELKSLHATSEAQLAADLQRRPSFVTPLVLACGSRNTKLIGIGVNCLQRLIAARCLARQKLDEVLNAFSELIGQGLDIQLRILQALPSLSQNYADELKGELLAIALSICSSLQGSKTSVVNNTAAATLQQLVVAVFDKVVAEDEKSADAHVVDQVETSEGPVDVQEAALDAYKVFNDICLLTEGRKPQFLRFGAVPQAFGLELIESVLTNHASVFLTHAEQAHILRERAMPFVIKSLPERLNFPTTVRMMRVLYIILRRQLSILTTQCEVALSLLIQILDPDLAPLWKRTLCMELFRGLYAEPGLIRKMYAAFDEQEGKKKIVRDHLAALVRLSTEKPAVIGLGQQSTAPRGRSGSKGSIDEQATLDAGGVVGMIGGAVTMQNVNVPGISMQGSSMRVSCIDHLDKAEPPAIPESYIYSLTLICLNTFTEGLAKFILPLTLPTEVRSRRKAHGPTPTHRDGRSSPSSDTTPPPLDRRDSGSRRSSRKPQVPINPLTLVQHPLYSEVKTSAAIVEACWPAVLAACSSFLHAALDNDYYHGLVRSIQKITQVSGLLRLPTPRDAFLTALGKAAVPPHVLSIRAAPPPSTPVAESPSLFANARGLLSVESLVGQSASVPAERPRPAPNDAGSATLGTRNLLCLRALLNLGIALGPTLDEAWSIILETLQQADFVIRGSARRPGRQGSMSGQSLETLAEGEDSSGQGSVASELRAVETATSRMLESTSDYPNEAFLTLAKALCKLLAGMKEGLANGAPAIAATPSLGPTTPIRSHRKIPSMSGVSAVTAWQMQEDRFIVDKLGDLANVNLSRLATGAPEASGWEVITDELISVACPSDISSSVRLRATEVLNKLVVDAATTTMTEPKDIRRGIQERLLSTLHAEITLLLRGVHRERPMGSSVTDVEVHRHALEAMRAILEQCGEALVSGWDIVFAIVATAFTTTPIASTVAEKARQTHAVSISPRLVRSSFGSLQLICSDFLPSLPRSCIVILVNTLSQFCSQIEELNISLTTVTFFWNVSDFLQVANESIPLGERASSASDEVALIQLAQDQDAGEARAASWLLLLLRLTAVTTDPRAEVRNGAVQTLLRIFDTYGDQLHPDAWRACLRTVIFRMMDDNRVQVCELDRLEVSTNVEEIRAWNETSIIILTGVTGFYADYLDLFVRQEDFAASWQTLIGFFSSLVPRKWPGVNAAVFEALRHVLEKVESRQKIGRPALELAWSLWAGDLPVERRGTVKAKGPNEEALVKYVLCFKEIYRLLQEDVVHDRVVEALDLLHQCVTESDKPAYSSDVESLTSVQARVLERLREIRTDQAQVPSALVMRVSRLVRLPFEQAREHSPGGPLSFIALSRSSMDLLQSLVQAHLKNTELYESGAFRWAMEALAIPITSKYASPAKPRGVPLWQSATEVAVAILQAAVPIIQQLSVDELEVQRIWNHTISIVIGVMSARVPENMPVANVRVDEDFDLTAFRQLRELIIPALGGSVVPDQARRAYADGLFRTSILHQPEPGEVPEGEREILEGLYTARLGRIYDPPPTARSRLCYTCLDELFGLVQAQDGSGPRVRLAQAASPFLILRVGITLRGYIADQPLRGRMPQPLTQRRELLYFLDKIMSLACEPRAIPAAPGVSSANKKHLHRLYPLVSKAVRVAARDTEMLDMLGQVLDEVGGEMGVM
ncbi:MAG: hypothetical protein M1838_000649 [Thelocarpon superellum]|nr:MAG: hypothetical protein M1838_000649 [Thelocarpon superellum]